MEYQLARGSQEGTGSACKTRHAPSDRQNEMDSSNHQAVTTTIGNYGLNELVLVPLWLQISRAQPMNPRVPDVSECSRIGARQLRCALYKTFQGLVPSLGDWEKV